MITRLLNRLNDSTCSFTTVLTVEKALKEKNFKELKMVEDWDLHEGGRYYIKKNNSAIFAIQIGKNIRDKEGYRIIAAHSDSPAFKLKPSPERIGDGGVVSLNVEKYGGGILYTWFDRPLSMSGRIVTNGKDSLHPKEIIFDIKNPIAVIPHLAIHFNRNVNDGNHLSVQKDMIPVVGYFSNSEIKEKTKEGGFIKSYLSQHLKIDVSDILDSEIFLYPLAEASLWGINKEYYQSHGIDDRSMVFAGLESLLESVDADSAASRVLAIFDNEETGSTTKQGAASPFLHNVLERIELTLGGDRLSFLRRIGDSFMISADCAHAWHPNYSEKYDPTNHPVIGGGPVIKINAAGKYMTDSYGSAVFQNLCKAAGVDYQFFVNHSDIAGGSTLGNILTSQIDLKGVDVGAPIWAMHSAIETGGVSDYIDFVKVFNVFWK